jgi:hypothetical protein
MSKILIEEDTARKVLKALEDHGHAWARHEVQYSNAMIAMREALAAQQEPEIEYCTNYHCAGDCGQPHNQKEMREFLAAAPQPAQQEPVGEVNRYGLDSHGRKWHGIHWYDPNVDVPHGTKLFTSPPAQRTWVGLTDEEIEEMANDFEEGYVFLYRSFARAIEAAHGIKENT